MSLQVSDFVLVLSGGSQNTDPNSSLGSDPSATPILNGVDNLFDDINEADALAGKVDYRCFYVFNDNATDTLFGVKIWLDSQTDEGSGVILGVTIQNDVQIITVIGVATAGSFTLSQSGHQVVCNFDPFLSNWGNNVQIAINSLPNISGAVVSASVFNNITTFQIAFEGDSGQRFQPQVTVSANNLVGTNVQVTATKLVSGSPINAIAIEIDQPTTVPVGVTFSDASETFPVLIGDLRPSDGIPIWLQRTTPPNSPPLANDSVTFELRGDPIN